MQDKTRREYLRLADHFLESRFIDSKPTVKTVSQMLHNVACEYRPAYWRRLKTALALYSEDKGNPETAAKIRGLVNPTTSCSPHLKKPKQRRVKSVSDEDHEKLIAHLKAHKDIECLAAVLTVYFTGCRPAEIQNISLNRNQTITIFSAKKIGAIRGCDRQLKLSNEAYRTLALLLPNISHAKAGKTSDISRIQRRLQRHVKKIWPKRKHHISLYSYRHQLGANLKDSRFSRGEVAAIMGHRSHDSVDVYGDKRASNQKLGIEALLACETLQVRQSPLKS
ncbi:tyrosine-type recombinase/integrase [Methylophaga pinxianii]|uniref:tyrosine-type recombinase/integrase n=1 Tax=Methylophaga pinxianii TaxID=2881052 RepID=UPI001CF511BF|nr:tyrosine-type recombinase/integrase [Methylophaga pinxianii]MCB2427127.1 tyrosine-type recombinase/integrase [Methylophaga pinxianii]UPH44970.1 tyrosine-type recombinase/integrase [Methylophaga pinxianii]